jgi:hypothetical protein
MDFSALFSAMQVQLCFKKFDSMQLKGLLLMPAFAVSYNCSSQPVPSEEVKKMICPLNTHMNYLNWKRFIQKL